MNSIDQALENPFVTETGRLQTLEHQQHGAYRLIANPIRTAGAETPAVPAPVLGEHTDAVLAELGYSPDKIMALRAAGIV